jgi:hypothetical protein
VAFRFLGQWPISYQGAAELRQMVVFTGKAGGEQEFRGLALGDGIRSSG